jgi:glycerol-3-phosphate dehydrogenase
VRRVAYRHGSLAAEVLEPCGERPSWRRALCRCEPVLEAEVRHAARRETARTLADVMRRTRLGAGPCGGIRCALPAALVLAEETGRDATWARAEARRFLEARARSRRAVVDGDEYRMDAIVREAARRL